MRKLIVWLLPVLILAACNSFEPIRIVITPTPAPTDVSVAAVATATTVVQPSPEPVTATSAATTTPLPTQTPPPTRTPIPGDGSFIGSILRPDYTITPPATSTPTLIPTLDPSAVFPSPTPYVPVAGRLDPLVMGLQIYYNMGWDEFADTLWLAQQTRVGWVKFQLDWSTMQPNGPGEKSDVFNAFVLQVQRAKNFGFKVLLSVAKAPAWARGGETREDGPPANPQDLINFLQLLFTDIKIENIDALEIWNEPNLLREWRGVYPLTGAGYMQLFIPVREAMRALYPSVHLITAGLAPTGNSEGSVDDRVFLQQMFDAGLGNYPDVSVGVHPYGWWNPPDARCCNLSNDRGWDDNPHFFFIETIDAYRDIMNRNGFSEVQMWITEFGWPTWDGFGVEPPEAWMGYTSPEQQAEYTLRAFEIGQSRPDIGPMILWNFNFANETLINNRDEMAGFSLLAPNMIEEGLIVRPLYIALRDRPQ
jgi:hypothetical protein